MRLIYLILAIFVVAILQIAVLPQLKLFGVSPNLILISVILISLRFSRQQMLFSALLLGFVLDLFSILPFGIFSLAMLCVGVIFNAAQFYLFTQTNFLVILVAIFAGTVFFNLFFGLFFGLFSLIQGEAFKGLLIHIISKVMPIEVAVNMLVIIFAGLTLGIINRIRILEHYRVWT